MEETEKTEHRLSGNQSFLTLLRASNGVDEPPKSTDKTIEERLMRASNGDEPPKSADKTNEEQNADTLRAGNVDQQKPPARNLSSLFEPPPPRRQSVEESPVPLSNSPYSLENSLRSPRKTTLKNMRRGVVLPGRGRAVSFDRLAVSKLEHDAMLQPNLPSLEAMEAARSVQKQNHPGVIQFQRLPSDRSLTAEDLQRMPSERAIRIDDLLSSGPYETEAETNILRAFEEHLQQTPNHHRLQSEASSILSGVPDAIAHDFSTSDETNSKEKYLPTRQLNGLPENDEFEDQGEPLVQQQPPHKRTQSVGDRLAGLTLAMQTLDATPTSNIVQVEQNSSIDTGSTSIPHGRKRLESLEEENDAIIEVSDESDDIENGNGDANVESSHTAANKPQLGKRWGSKSSNVLRGARNIVQDSEHIWKSFYRSRKYQIRKYVTTVGSLMVLLLTVASLLYYALDNPLTETANGASVSWYLLFCVRQIITLTLALITQIFVVDFLGISTQFLLRFIGQYFTLLVILSRGWPFSIFMWSVYDLCLLHGDRGFSSHWGSSQNMIGLFNNSNPGGNVVSSPWNSRVLYIAFCVALATALKRFVLGLYLGRQTFEHYGENLAKVLGKMLVVSQVAHVAKKVKTKSILPENIDAHIAMLRQVESEGDDNSVDSTLRSAGTQEKTIDMNKTDPLTGRLDDLEKAKLNQLLGQWEEPDRIESGSKGQIPISEVLRFRNALTVINNDYPFSYSFGLANTREAAIRSAQVVYNRLLSATPLQAHLQFETLVLIALKNDGSIDVEKAKDVIRVFRPDREGNLALIDFMKSVDSIYKEFRLLQASIGNSSQIDRKFESIVNVVFYGIVITIVLSQIGVDPLSLFLSLSSVIVAFAFMIGSASSKYFEGLIFVLARRPYGIGDVIHISDVEQGTSPDGSIGWIVNDVTLSQTTATWIPTLEVASFSNGSLSSSRIINWARSPNARFNIKLSFPISTNYEKIEIFKRAVEEYLKVRPREWRALDGFRVDRVFSEHGYMSVIITVTHRDSWQNTGQILDSKSNFVTYCHEVQKKLGMQYTAPPLPVDLSYTGNDLAGLVEKHAAYTEHNNDQLSDTNSSFAQEEYDNQQVQQFRAMAMKKYNIRVS